MTSILKYQGQVIQELSGLTDPYNENMTILRTLFTRTILQIRKLNCCLEYKLLQRISLNFGLCSHAVSTV